MKKLVVLMLALGLLSWAPLSSWGGGFWGPSPEDEPSVLSYGMAGFGLGAVLGLSGGYLSAVKNDEWKHLITGPAYGAIIGAGLGLTIGMFDAGKKYTGVGGIILRDMRMGSGLGIAIGLAVGTIRAVDSSEWNDLGKGIAWGSLIGAGGGLLFGIYEGPKIVKSASLPSVNITLVKGNPGLILEKKF